jgi:molybdopterin-guanine dinucleotide biosynthesis protein A
MQPLCARYAVRCLQPIDELIREGHFSVLKLYPRVRAEFVEFDDGQPFIDIDTAEDLDAAKRISEG